MGSFIPYGTQDITKEDIKEVINTLKSDYLTQGPKVPEFENLVSKYCDSSHSLAFNSATSALHVACLSLEIGSDDIVWTSPISFVASSNCALYCGAKIDFVDIDPKTNNICPKNLEKKLIAAKDTGALPKAVIVVHLTGLPCDLLDIHKLSIKFGFKIIEDASHAIGASYKNNKIGSCEFSDVTIFSFHPVKIITTGEGGVLTTNKKEIYDNALLFRSHGVTKDKNLFKKQNYPTFYYEQHMLGFNYRLTDLSASLGISQLARLTSFLKSRNKIAKKYTSELSSLPIETPVVPKDRLSSFHLYVIKVDKQNKKSRDDFFKYMQENNIGVNLHYIPIYRQPYYENMFNFNKEEFPNAEDYFQRAISLPIFPKLGQKQEIVISKIKEYFE